MVVHLAADVGSQVWQMNALERQDVLVVDDDEGIRNLLRAALRRAGMSCELAVDGLDALERIRQADYALVLLDVMMPRLDGFGFVNELREQEQKDGSRPVVLIMTAAPGHPELTATGDIVQAVIAKPFDLSELANLVHDCVAARRDQEFQAGRGRLKGVADISAAAAK